MNNDTEMRTMQGVSKVTEKMADFAGDIIMQLLQKQGYVEERGVKALLHHVKKGGRTKTTIVSEQRAEQFKELMKKAHIPFVEIEHLEPKSKERMMFFVYRDVDAKGVNRVIKEFELGIAKSAHEVDLDTFEKMMDKKQYGTLAHLTKEELYAFREAAGNYGLTYCVIADKDRYSVIGSDAKTLEHIAKDMCFDLSGERGRAYENALSAHFKLQEDFVERLKPEAGKVKYVVSAKNPQNFISVDEQGITTHSIGSRKVMNGERDEKAMIYDVKHNFYPGYDREKLKLLAMELATPIVLSEEEFRLVEGLSKTKEAILVPNFVEEYGRFMEQRGKSKADLTRLPKRKPLYESRDLIGYKDVPLPIISQLQKKALAEVYIDGCDVAYPMELETEMNEFWDETLYQDMEPQEKEQSRQQYERVDDNAAITYMLMMEHTERSALKAKHITPEALNEVQKEALERFSKKEIKENVMNKEVAKVLQERMMDKRMERGMDR